MTTTQPRTSTPVPAPIAPAQPARRHGVMGVLPYIGVILFGVATFQQFSGGTAAAGDWGPTLVTNAVVYLIGWSMLGAGIAHLLFSRRTSASIGFTPGGFQTEVGFADLAMGITALLAASYSTQYALAIILASSIYRVGCGIGHIRSMVRDRNFAINNTAILVVNFLVPAFLLFAYYSWA
jgi:hypothetical protein